MDPNFRNSVKRLIAGANDFPIKWHWFRTEEIRTYNNILVTYHYLRYVSARFGSGELDDVAIECSTLEPWVRDDSPSASFAFEMLRQNFGDRVGCLAFSGVTSDALRHMRRRCRVIRYECDKALRALDEMNGLRPVRR